MHPYFIHRGPSRLFWFIIGAGTATWWHCATSMRDHRGQFFSCVRRVQDQHPDRDTERLIHLQKRASDTVTDLSESTLDSIISGAESLKAKLAQLRAERERLEAEKAAQPSVSHI